MWLDILVNTVAGKKKKDEGKRGAAGEEDLYFYTSLLSHYDTSASFRPLIYIYQIWRSRSIAFKWYHLAARLRIKRNEARMQALLTARMREITTLRNNVRFQLSKQSQAQVRNRRSCPLVFLVFFFCSSTTTLPPMKCPMDNTSPYM
jgi:outer membrane phospholipase A